MITSKNIYILQGTEAFTRGELDNVALTKDAICLEQTAGRHVPCGCFTSPPIAFAAFDRLTVSWNAETPPGTVVEAGVRVMQEEGWTGWFSCGKWSPYIKRAGIWQDETLPISMQGDVLHLAARASQVQLRIYLYTENERVSPAVHQLAVSVRPVSWERHKADLHSFKTQLPAYTIEKRDPALKTTLDIPMALAGMMNRFGQDILPEEAALGMYDHAKNDSENRSFAAALAGCYGYIAHTAYHDPATVWRCIKNGDCVAVTLRCLLSPGQVDFGQPVEQLDEHVQPREVTIPPKTPFWRRKQALEQAKQQAQAEAETKELELLAAKNAPTKLTGALNPEGRNVLMPLRGFEQRADGMYALVNDPTALTDEAAQRMVPEEEFWAAFTGFALVIKGKNWGWGAGSPHRTKLALAPTPAVGRYQFETKDGEKVLLPHPFGGSIACAIQQQDVSATTAHKQFYYGEATQDGSIQLPNEVLLASKKVTIYAINTNGDTYVGDLHLGG